METKFKNPFIFDQRPIPCVSVHFRTLLDTKDSSQRQLWTSFISKVMREEKSRYKYSQVPLIREYLYSQSKFDVKEVLSFVSFSMRDALLSIDPIIQLIDKDTLAFILAISGLNIKEYIRQKKNLIEE